MPIYEYKCKKCDKLFEVLAGSYADQSLPCPLCGSPHTEKLMSVAGCITKSAGMPSHCSSGPSCAAAGATCGGCCGMSR